MRTVLLFFLIPIGFLTKAQTKAVAVKGNWVVLNDDGTWKWATVNDDGTWKYADSLRTQSQIDSVRKSESEYVVWNRALTYSAQMGVWIPIGNLAKTFGPGFNFRLGLGSPVREGFRVDLGFSISVFESSRKFNYFLKDTTLIAKSSSWVMIGLQLSKEVEFKKRVLFDFLDIHAGVGASIIDTNKKKPHKDEDDPTYSVETVHLNTGFSLRRKVLNKRSIGVSVQYNFTPQRLFSKNVEKGFGNSSITTGVMYRF